MRGKVSTVILILILVIGLSLLLYPTFADWWNSFHASRAIANYDESVAALDDTSAEAMMAAARSYNESLPMLMGNRYEPDAATHEKYMNILDVTGTGIMGYIQIPSINVSLPIYHTVADTVLQIAAGHIEGTSLPVGGMGTHCVISGHRGLPSARLFTDLDKLTEGDVFMLKVLNETFTYQVDQIRIVLPEEVDQLQIEPDHDYCTLVTCTPYGVNSHRMLVRGTRIDNLPEAVETIIVADAVQIEPMLVDPAIAAPILLILFIGVMIRGRKKH